MMLRPSSPRVARRAIRKHAFESGKQEKYFVSLTSNPVSFRRVLVLEDNFIIAMEAEDILRSLGVEMVEIATNRAQAMELIEDNTFDFALLDVNLGIETSFAFADTLLERRLPFGFVTGYGESAMFPQAFRDIPWITKPFNEDSIRHLLTVSVAPDAA